MMGKQNDSLGDRMKEYEGVPRHFLTRRIPAIIRLDGKAFHTFTRGMKKPFDCIMMATMQETMKYLCENIQGCVLGYTQSDEITLVLTDYATIKTDGWFGYNVQKMASVSASMATLAFNENFIEHVEAAAYAGGIFDTEEEYERYKKKFNKALFDSRVFYSKRRGLQLLDLAPAGCYPQQYRGSRTGAFQPETASRQKLQHDPGDAVV